MSRKDYPTLEENIRFIISDIGAQVVLQAMSIEEIIQSSDPKALFVAFVEKVGAEKIYDYLSESLYEMRKQALRQVLQNFDKEALFRALVKQIGIKRSQQLLREWSQENGGDNEKRI